MEKEMKLVEQYGKAIAHMRQLTSDKKLGLTLGAGLSQSAGFPSWTKLLKGISEQLIEQDINGRVLEGESEPMQAQILFSRFSESLKVSDEFKEIDPSHHEAEVATQWRNIIRRILYKGVDNIAQSIESHPYLKSLASHCFKVPVVVSYNFDELLEKALAISEKKPANTVGYYSAWGASFVVQNDRPVVYHPNGFVPEHTIDRFSEMVVLTEESMSDQIIDTALGSYSLLLDYFSKSPCLFIGFSLSDPGMRSILRQASRKAPGTAHYYIHYCHNEEKPSDKDMVEISRINFDLYNFVTLFLNSSDISCLLNIISHKSDDEFKDLFVQSGVSPTYLYNITGAISVGKTTAIARLQGMTIIDEWLSPREQLIAKSTEQLNEKERETVDRWVLDQVRLKNRRFIDANVGLHVMDRAPLDPFAFVEKDNFEVKARQIYDIACAGDKREPQKFKEAFVILLLGDPKQLHMRQKWRGRAGGIDYIKKQQEALESIYCPNGEVAVIQTNNKSIAEVVKEVSRAIHCREYRPYKLHERLQDLGKNLF